jgi:hypothetical protein
MDFRGEVRDELLPAHAGPRELGAAARLRRIRIAQIQARAEAAPSAGEHHDPAVVIRADPVEGGMKVLDELVVQRVELLGPVQGEHGDVGARVGQFEVRHGHTLTCLAQFVLARRGAQDWFPRVPGRGDGLQVHRVVRTSANR